MRASALRDALGPAAALLALVAVSLFARTLLPVDETRYASVAWEMVLRGDWLVLHMNGVPYSHKPPLLFWLVGAGWSAFGASEAWVRLVPALFSVASLFLVARLARRLWPDDRDARALAPWILAGTGLSALFGTVAFFDPLLAFFVLLGAEGVLAAAEGRRVAGWLRFGIALGLGVLSKGPVILVHALPVALLAPWWGGSRVRSRRIAWYAGTAGAVALGAAVALAWAVPAARAGGEAFGRELLWGQTANRMVQSFAHRRAWWFYLAFVPVVTVPWSLWPPLVRALAALRRGPMDRGVRFCATWALSGLALLSVVSGKQPQYLLPLVPAFALLAARALSRAIAASPHRERPSRVARALPAACLVATGAVLSLASARLHAAWLPEWTQQIPAWGGIALIAGAALYAALPRSDTRREAHRVALVCLSFLVALHVAVVPAAMTTQDVRGVAELLHRIEAQGRPVAHAGNYEAQYQFLGRLLHPLEEIERAEVAAWAAAHPRGAVVLYVRRWVPGERPGPDYAQPYRGQTVTVWSSAAILEEVAAGRPRWE